MTDITRLEIGPRAGYIAEMKSRTATYLNRSAQHPLTLVVRIESGLIVEKFYATIWGMLLSYSDRWKRADLDIKNRVHDE